jgi:hypothetical protein
MAYLEISSTKGEVMHRQPLKPVSHLIESRPEIAINGSFCTLQVIVPDIPGHHISITTNGEPLPTQRIGGTHIGYLQLDNDLLFRRVEVITDAGLYAGVDFFVEHVYLIGKTNTFSSFSFKKWDTSVYAAELDRWRQLFLGSEQHNVQLRNAGRALTPAAFHKPEWRRAILEALMGVVRVASTTPPEHFFPDFSEPSEGEFDSELLMDMAQDDRRILTRAERGPIRYKGRRYSPVFIPFREDNPGAANFAPLISLARFVSEKIAGRVESTPAIRMYAKMLLDTAMELPSQHSSNGDDFAKLLGPEFRSSVGRELQHYCRELVFLAQVRTLDTSPREIVAKAFMRGLRDFDVFQTTCYTACALALGYSEESILTSAGKLEGGSHSIYDLNREGASEALATLLGWREKSLQPAEYRPDILILYDQKVPLLLDAKFRTSQSKSLIADPNSLKDMQAYMDEFGASVGILLVPKIIHHSILCEHRATYCCISGAHSSGLTKSIFCVEIPNSHQANVITNLLNVIRETAAAA